MKREFKKIATFRTGLRPLEIAHLDNCNFENRIRLENAIFEEIAVKCKQPQQLPAFSKNKAKIYILAKTQKKEKTCKI